MQNTEIQRKSTVYGYDDPPSYMQLFDQEMLDRYLSLIDNNDSLYRNFYQLRKKFRLLRRINA